MKTIYLEPTTVTGTINDLTKSVRAVVGLPGNATIQDSFPSIDCSALCE